MQLPALNPVRIVALAAALALTSFALRFPGGMGPDANRQYEQALSGQFNDWHPPVMAWVWSWLLPIADGPAVMLAFHLLLFWAGIAAIALALHRRGDKASALLVLVSGASPLLVYYNGLIYKDTAVSSALVAAFGLAFWHRSQGRRLGWLAGSGIALLLIYGTLARSNAVFAFAPLALYAFAPRMRLRTAALAVPVLAVLAIPLSSFVNHQLFDARRSGIDRALFFYDLAGIARHSRDMSVVPAELGLTQEGIDRCYSPWYWDPISDVRCGIGFRMFAADINVGRAWAYAIARHPLAYAEHRLKHFNASQNFLVPAMACRFALFDVSCGTRDASGRSLDTPETRRVIAFDYVKKSAAVWPVTWLAAGLAICALLWRRRREPAVAGALVLLSSGLLYGLGYGIVGVAADLRYYLWMILAVQTGILISWRDLWAMRRETRAHVALGAVMTVVVLGYVARISDWSALMR